MKLAVSGKFWLDDAFNPPPLRTIRPDDAVGSSVDIGRGVWLYLPPHADVLHRVLDVRPLVDRKRFTGLGCVTDACQVACISNTCANWSVKSHRPRVVAKVVGVLADEPRYVVLSQPRLRGSERARRETRANRVEAGLVPCVLVEPGTVQCPRCGNVGEVRLEAALAA